MSKPYTETDFSTQITEDRNWRIKEISDLKAAVLRGDAGARRVLLRALVAICYAHWEGYVKYAANKYLEHIALRRLAYNDLSPQFLRNYFVPRLAAIASTKLSISDRCAMVDEILNSFQKRFSRVNGDLVSTRSNLSFSVFSDICLVCDVPIHSFITKSDFIDKSLHQRRNAIAHGEETLVAIDDLDEVAGKTIALMREFGDALENQVTLQTYKATQGSKKAGSN